jgi:hypothetical protein
MKQIRCFIFFTNDVIMSTINIKFVYCITSKKNDKMAMITDQRLKEMEEEMSRYYLNYVLYKQRKGSVILA